MGKIKQKVESYYNAEIGENSDASFIKSFPPPPFEIELYDISLYYLKKSFDIWKC